MVCTFSSRMFVYRYLFSAREFDVQNKRRAGVVIDTVSVLLETVSVLLETVSVLRFCFQRRTSRAGQFSECNTVKSFL